MIPALFNEGKTCHRMCTCAEPVLCDMSLSGVVGQTRLSLTNKCMNGKEHSNQFLKRPNHIHIVAEINHFNSVFHL